jgi:hypothetical protein
MGKGGEIIKAKSNLPLDMLECRRSEECERKVHGPVEKCG